METYQSLNMLYFLKTIVSTLIVLMPIIFTVSAASRFLKCKFKLKKINYIKLFGKIIFSFCVLVMMFCFDKYRLFSDIEIINQWHNVNTSRILAYEDEQLTYVPVVIEPMYIKNQYSINIESLKTKLLDIIGDKDVSLSFYNFNSFQEFDINGDEMYFAASVSKIHTVMNLYDYAYENNIDLKQVKVKYISSDFQGGSGILQGVSDLKNKSYSLDYLAEISIRYSDNIARNMINRYMSSRRSTVSYYKQIVGSDNVLSQKNYLMSANWAVKIMKKLYFNEDENPFYNKLIYDMKNTASSSNIAEYIDYDKVAHKIGLMNMNGYLYSNDAAIIYSDSEYILTVFTKSKMTTDEASDLIGRISQTIYNEITASV